MDQPESDELRKEFSRKKQESVSIRAQLQALSTEKEPLFRQLKILRDKIQVKITQIAELKRERDQRTSQVKQVKQEREKLNLLMKEKAGEKKKVEEKKQVLLEKAVVPQNPHRLKVQIEQLERKIETEVMPFEQEKRIRKQIKELQVLYKQAELVGGMWREVKAVTSDFVQSRHLAQDSHHKVQDLAQQSQQKHEEMNKVYEDVKLLRAEEKPLLEKYQQLRKQQEELKKTLLAVQARVAELSKVFQEDEGTDFRSKVREKKAAVQDKLKKGKKLSMDDILAFQASNE